MPGFSTLRARGPQRARDPGPRLPAREAAHDARRLSPEPQRAASGLQPGDQPRSRHRVRRGGHPRRAAPPVTPALDAAGQRRGQPRAEVPPPARRGAGAARGRARGAVRAHAPRGADARRAQAAHGAPAPTPRPLGGPRRARAADRPRARRAPAAPAGAEGGALHASAERRRAAAGRSGRRPLTPSPRRLPTWPASSTLPPRHLRRWRPPPRRPRTRASGGWRTRSPPCAPTSRRCAPRSTPCARSSAPSRPRSGRLQRRHHVAAAREEVGDGEALGPAGQDAAGTRGFAPHVAQHRRELRAP